MPVLAKPPSKLTDWVNQEDSVVENPWMQALKKVVKFTGITDPESQIEGLMNPMAAPLVSLFKNKAAREASTKLFRDKANIMGGPVAEAAMEFADDYPRVAAHIKPSYVTRGSNPTATTQLLKEHGRVPVAVRRGSKSEALEDFYHEGTHTAQALGNSKFDELYDEADELLGYNDNPFELSAWDAGLRASGQRLPSYQQPQNAIKALEGYAEDLGPTSKLAQILQSRAKKPSLPAELAAVGEEGLHNAGRPKPPAKRDIYDVLMPKLGGKGK